MNQEILTFIYQIRERDILEALRNNLLGHISTPALLERLASDPDMDRVLGALDPRSQVAAKDLEEALRAFELGLRLVGAPGRRGMAISISDVGNRI